MPLCFGVGVVGKPLSLHGVQARLLHEEGWDSRVGVGGKFTVSASTFAPEVENQQSSVFSFPGGHQRAVCPVLHSNSLWGCKYICILDWPQTSAWLAIVSFLSWVYIFKRLGVFCAILNLWHTFPTHFLQTLSFSKIFTVHSPLSNEQGSISTFIWTQLTWPDAPSLHPAMEPEGVASPSSPG